jgi:hypothetical protein
VPERKQRSRRAIAAGRDAPQNGASRRDSSAAVDSAAADGPPWLASVQQTLRTVAALSPDWNGTRAEPTRSEVLASAEELLRTWTPHNLPEPNLLPLPSGGLGIEWHAGGIDLEIAIEGPDLLDVLFTDHRTGSTWDAEAIAPIDDRLRERLKLLATRVQ